MNGRSSCNANGLDNEKPDKNDLMAKKITAYAAGLRAEKYAALLLRLKGYRILARRYKCAAGEIDLIARRGGVLVFAEVKYRPTLTAALTCLAPRGRTRLENAARHYLATHPCQATMILRFDFIALAPPLYWRHLDNAWMVTT